MSTGRRLGRYSRVSWPWPLIALCYLALIGFALFYGFAFGLLSAVTVLPFLAPQIFLVLLAIWALPQMRSVPVRMLRWLLSAFTIALLIWPNYIALAVEPLPWITAIRLTGIPLMLVLLICYFRSTPFRKQLADILTPTEEITWLLLAYLLITTVTIVMSPILFNSISQYFVIVYSIIAVFFASTYYFTKVGAAHRFVLLLLGTTVLSVLIGGYEIAYKHLPWVGHIPSFLAIEDPRVLGLLQGTARAATGEYRIQSKFTTSIGLGEYMGMTLPFLLHLFFVTKSRLIKLLLLLLAPAMFVVVLKTQSRLAFICFLSSVVMYILFRALLTWRDGPNSLFAPALALAYPAFLTILFIASLVWRRLTVMVWGGGAEQASTQSRKDQWAGTWPHVFHNPLGHGIGSSGLVLGYIAPGQDFPTVDSYYITQLLDIGVLGFLVYYGMFVAGIVRSGLTALKTRDEETLYLAAACIALVNFVLSKSVYSQTENHPLAIMILAMVVALVRRYKTEAGQLPAPPVEDELIRRRADDVMIRQR